jgi:serine/threonine-protein kinase RsbW
VNPPDSIARARLTVGCGPMARPLAGRLLMSIGAETDLPLDRVQEAALVAETIVELCKDASADGTIELAVRADGGRIELRVGPLAPGGAQKLLGADALGGAGGVMRALASKTAVRQGRAGTEILVFTVLAHPAQDIPSSI